jgi:hypothetical protein
MNGWSDMAPEAPVGTSEGTLGTERPTREPKLPWMIHDLPQAYRDTTVAKRATNRTIRLRGNGRAPELPAKIDWMSSSSWLRLLKLRSLRQPGAVQFEWDAHGSTMRRFVRRLFEPLPMRLLALREIDRRLGFLPYERRIALGSIERPAYGHGVCHAARLAAKLGHGRISVIEFGVAV